MTTEIEARPVRGEPATRLGQWSWALFDWANQPYFTLVTTFVFAPYFATGFVGDPVRGQELWGYTQSIAGACIALMSPVFGSIADVMGRRKPWIAGFAVFFIAGCLVLWTAAPGAPRGIAPIMAAVVVAAVAMEFAIVFNNAMLPTLVPNGRMGRLSGLGWGIGYVGGLVALVLVLVISGGEPDDTAARISGPLAAVWFAIFALPLFLFTPDQPATGQSVRTALVQGTAMLWGTVKRLGLYRNVAVFLIARMTYIDGLSAIFAFGGIYAAGTFDWSVTTLALFGIILSIFAAIGAFVGGALDDILGSKRTIQIAVAGLGLGTCAAASVTRDSVLFVFDVAPRAADATPLTSIGEMVYLAFGIVIGLFSGPAQAASRTLMARLAPPGMTTEFFGLYALSGKATAFVAPYAIAVMTAAFASQRAGLVVIVVFLALGFLLLIPVREQQAVDLAEQS